MTTNETKKFFDAKDKLKGLFTLVLFVSLFFLPKQSFAQIEIPAKTPDELKKTDSDNDGLSDFDEINIYHTNINLADTDLDGFSDGEEIKFNYDPNKNTADKLEKKIVVVLADQSLSYRLGDYIVGAFKISSGLAKTPTPSGEYEIIIKRPVVHYKGAGYDYKNTRWNLMFKKGRGLNYYIHGTYWHNDFGRQMSHGCVNVSYENIEPLYNWADVGTKVEIR